MKLRRTVLITLVAATTAANVVAAEEPVYAGEYFYNFENSYLTPDGKHEEWCIDPRLMARAMLPAQDANGRWCTSRVEVRGTLGPEGSYGGLGRCRRVLTVTELVKVSNMRGRE